MALDADREGDAAPTDYEYDEKDKRVLLTEDGTERMERLLEAEGLLVGSNLYDYENTQVVHHLNQALRANVAFKRDIDYIVKDEQGRHHRPVHRPHDGRPALVGRPAPGGRGQGRRPDRAREPDPRLDHLPELFPHVSQALGHDRHRGDRGGGILRHLQDERRLDPDQHAGPARSTTTTNSTRTRTTSSARSSRRSRRSRISASRCWSAPSRSRNRNCSRNISRRRKIKHEVLNARFHEQEAHIVAQAGRLGRSPSPPTWPAAAPTSSSAAISSSASSDELAEMEPGPERDKAEEKIKQRGRRGEGAGDRRRRPVRARHRAPREPAHRQPAARPLRPPGRSRPQPLLSVASTTICCASSARRRCSRG